MGDNQGNKGERRGRLCCVRCNDIASAAQCVASELHRLVTTTYLRAKHPVCIVACRIPNSVSLALVAFAIPPYPLSLDEISGVQR